MINAGAGALHAQTPKLNQLSLKQTYLYLMFGAVNSYSEAIFQLCKDFRPQSGFVLLRPILEGWINTAYFLSHNSENRLKALIMYDSFSKLAAVKEMEEFSKKYPWVTKNSLLSDANLATAKTKIEGDIQNLKKHGLEATSKNEVEKFSYFEKNLKERARKVDRKYKKSDSRAPHVFEYQYLIVYSYFSGYIHLSLEGTNNFIVKTSGGYEFDIGQSTNGVEIVLTTLYIFYLSFLNMIEGRNIMKIPGISDFNKYFSQLSSKKSR